MLITLSSVNIPMFMLVVWKLQSKEFWVMSKPIPEGTKYAKIAARQEYLQNNKPSKNISLNKQLDPKGQSLNAVARGLVRQLSSIKKLLPSFKKESDYLTVELSKRLEDHAADLGFTLHGGNDNPCFPGDPGIFIKHVVSGSSADSMLRPGDRVLSINGINVSNVPVKYARQVVRKAKNVVRLEIKKAPKRQQRINEAIKKEYQLENPMFCNEEIEGFEDAFSVFDVNGNSKIKVREVFPLIRSLGHNPTEDAVWCYLNELNLAGKRKVTFVEFIRVMESLITDEEREENGCGDAVRVFDPEQRGWICLNELQVALRSMPGSAQMKDFELRDILQKADPDGDGKVQIQDFQRLFDRQ